MTEQNDSTEVEKIELDSVYPVHYHGYIKYYNSVVTKPITTVSKELMKQYGEDFEILGIG